MYTGIVRLSFEMEQYRDESLCHQFPFYFLRWEQTNGNIFSQDLTLTGFNRTKCCIWRPSSCGFWLIFMHSIFSWDSGLRLSDLSTEFTLTPTQSTRESTKSRNWEKDAVVFECESKIYLPSQGIHSISLIFFKSLETDSI